MTSLYRTNLLIVSILFMMVLLFTTIAGASEVSVPLKLDYHFLRRILIEQVYTDQNDTARVFEEQKDCSILVFSNPQIGPDAN